MIKWSVLAGVLGVLGTGVGTTYLSRGSVDRPPTLYWLLGIAALLPAWLIAFLDLLTRSSGPRPEKALIGAWILSSSSALLGVIVTDAVVKRLRESGRDHRSVIFWLLGAAALLPAWGIALFALSMAWTPK